MARNEFNLKDSFIEKNKEKEKLIFKFSSLMVSVMTYANEGK